MQLYRTLFNDMQLYRTLFNDMQLYRTVILILNGYKHGFINNPH